MAFVSWNKNIQSTFYSRWKWYFCINYLLGMTTGTHKLNAEYPQSIPFLLVMFVKEYNINRPYGNRSFRTQVISYPSHFVLFWSFRTHFYSQFGHFVSISYPVWSFRTYFYYLLENHFGHFVRIFYCFVPKSFRTRSHFVPISVISYPGHFVPTSKLGTNWIWNEMTFFFFCCNLLLPDQIRIDLGIIIT